MSAQPQDLRILFTPWGEALVRRHYREAMLALPGTGFVTLSVIDAEGRSDRVDVRLR